MATGKRKRKGAAGSEPPRAREYRHPGAESPLRPDVGTQSQFRKKKPPTKYRYDSSLSPALDWDGKNSAREMGEWLIGIIEKGFSAGDPLSAGANHAFNPPEEFKGADGSVLLSIGSAREALEQLKRLSQPFLNWTGKAERLSFDVPTLPLFVHERLSTKAIIETLKGHKKATGPEQMSFLFGDPQRPVADQVLKAYEYKDKWTNRMILGDSLVAMNSLLRYEGMGGQVQMIYIDPPYGVKFGSNFQPFVRKRDVTHGDDEDMTREPEMVKAYRDTWELGLHSYLTYMRDRLLLARELLTDSGSCFVQISDENVHHVREIMDDIFGGGNFVGLITFRKKFMSLSAQLLDSMSDYLLFYSKNKANLKYKTLFKAMKVEGDNHWNYIDLPDGNRRKLTTEEVNNHKLIPTGAKIFQLSNLYPAGVNPSGIFEVELKGKKYFL